MGGGASRKAEPYIISISDVDNSRASGRDSPPTIANKDEESKLGSPKMLSRKTMGASSSKMMKSVSAAGAARKKSESALGLIGAGGSPSGKKSAVEVSRKLPWLLKNASLNGSQANNFESGRVIGTGLMGTVRIAKLKDANLYLAIKSVRKDYILKHNDERHLQNERSLMLLCTSPFCIKLFGTFQDTNNVCFAMELAVGGELFRRLNKKETLGPNTAKFYVTEIFAALEHIHSLGYVYRDLKPENVLLDEEGHCKLVDFGFSTIPDASGMMRTFCGTPAYLSPEQLNGKFTGGYTKVVDWWSLGVLLFELMTGLTPFCKNNREGHYEIYLRILKTKIAFPRNFDASSKELIQSLCHADMAKRLCDVEKIKVHSYFEIDWALVNQRRMIPPFVPRVKDVSDRDHYFDDYGRDVPQKDIDVEYRQMFEGF